MNVPMSPILDVVHLTFLMLQCFGDKSVRTTPLLYFLRAIINCRCFSIRLDRSVNRFAIFSCSGNEGRKSDCS